MLRLVSSPPVSGTADGFVPPTVANHGPPEAAYLVVEPGSSSGPVRTERET
ncbi:hypothetical protein ACFOLD_08495 [Kocuria carniphila]|uniref:hypothetical protein n=1 Tax=Kocuria carniphila TaxID=262208 RepID=UPI00361CD9EA